MKKSYNINNKNYTLKFPNYFNDEELVLLINTLIDVITENYKNIKKQIKEGKSLFEKENKVINILSNIELELNSFISKAKEIIQGIKILRKNEHEKKKNLISPTTKINDNNKIIKINKKQEKKNEVVALEKIKNSSWTVGVGSERNNNKEENKEIKKYNLNTSSFNQLIKKRNVNNIINAKSNYLSRSNNKLELFGKKSNDKIKKLIEENKIEKKLEKGTLFEKRRMNNKKINHNKNIEKKIPNQDLTMKNLEVKIDELTSDLRISNDIYNQKISKVKIEIKENLENIEKLKNEINKKNKIISKTEKDKNNVLNENKLNDNNNEDKIFELSELNSLFISRNNELYIKILELTNSNDQILEKNTRLSEEKANLENIISNLKNEIKEIKTNENINNEKRTNNKEINLTNNSLNCINNNDLNINNNVENINNKINELNNENEKKEISKQLIDLKRTLKIKDLAIDCLTGELNLKDSQISQLILEKVKSSKNQENKNLNDSNVICIQRSKSEKSDYSYLKKENKKLINRINCFSNIFNSLLSENQLNKKTIFKLNRKIDLINSKKYSSVDKEINEKYEKKLKEINSQYKNNEKFLQNQIKELKELNLEKDDNIKKLQNEFLKLELENKNKKS